MKFPVWLIIIIIGFLVLVKGCSNIEQKPNPPASCQLFGGHWTLWGGWSCG